MPSRVVQIVQESGDVCLGHLLPLSSLSTSCHIPGAGVSDRPPWQPIGMHHDVTFACAVLRRGILGNIHSG